MGIRTKLILSIILIAFSAGTVAALPPQSFNGVYLGGNVSKEQFKDGYANASIMGGMFRVGYDFNKFFAVETQLGATVAKGYQLLENGQQVGEYTIRGEHSGLYGRVNWRLINVSLYGLLGVGYYKKIEENKYNLHQTDTMDDTGLSFGVGVVATILASLLPARRAVRMSVVEALRQNA